MDTSKVIITKQKRITNKYSFENEVGLSSYDLALISIGKIQSKPYLTNFTKTTYLI
tara:strand:+ start:369 stop:536 length:168 start_codon:yes stop_codon:yes gene_type:complete